jgi:hypothetical protein
MLGTSCVLLFVKSVDVRDREKVGLLLETDDGLTADWAVGKRVCGRFDKRPDWVEKDSSGAGIAAMRKVEVPLPARREETRSWPDAGSTSTSVVRGPSREAALEELTQMVRTSRSRKSGTEGLRLGIGAYGATQTATPEGIAGTSPKR